MGYVTLIRGSVAPNYQLELFFFHISLPRSETIQHVTKNAGKKRRINYNQQSKEHITARRPKCACVRLLWLQRLWVISVLMDIHAQISHHSYVFC